MQLSVKKYTLYSIYKTMTSAKKSLPDHSQWKNSVDNKNIQYVVCDPVIYPSAQKLRVQWLYVLWNIALLEQQSIGIVWSRDMTAYGKKIIDCIVWYLAWHSIVTVSWGAIWVDTAVHKESICLWVPTIMVLAWGIDRYLSSTKHALCTAILEQGGLLVSEYEPMVEPKKYTFPQRNRIIAMLGEIIVIPEAWEKSWALITATYANKIGISVYGAPQDIFSISGRWVNKYISTGNITCMYSILDMLKQSFPLITWEQKNDISTLPAKSDILDPVERSLHELGLL